MSPLGTADLIIALFLCVAFLHFWIIVFLCFMVLCFVFRYSLLAISLCC